MSARNDITGDSIRTKSSSASYRSNWDRIFGNKEKKLEAEYERGFNEYRELVKEMDATGATFAPDYYEKLLKANEGASEVYKRGALEGIRVAFLEI